MVSDLIWALDLNGPQEIWSPRKLSPEKFGPGEIWSLHENHHYIFMQEQIFAGPKFLGNQIFWGPNFLRTKFLGDQKSQGPKCDRGPFQLQLTFRAK